MNSLKLNSFSFIFLIFVFSPFLSLGGLNLPFPYLALLGCFLLFLAVFIFYKVDFELLKLLGVFYLGFVYFVVSSIININRIDTVIFLMYIASFFTITSCFFLAWLFVKVMKGQERDVLYVVLLVGFLHSLIMIFSFVSPAVKGILYSFVVLGDVGTNFVEKNYRAPGLSAGGGDALSYIQSIALVVALYLVIYVEKNLSFFKLMSYLFVMFFLFASILLSGRLGLVTFLFGIGVIVALKSRWLSFYLSKQTLYRGSFLFMSLLLIIVGLFVVIMNSEYYRLANRAFELYINFISSNEIRTSSTDELFTMYFLPDTINQIIWGTGNFGRDKTLGIIDTDVGYIRVIFGVGTVGLVFMFLWVIYLIFRAFAFKTSILRVPVLFICVTTLLVNFKVFHYAEMRESFKVLLFMYFSMVLIKNRLVKE